MSLCLIQGRNSASRVSFLQALDHINKVALSVQCGHIVHLAGVLTCWRALCICLLQLCHPPPAHRRVMSIRCAAQQVNVRELPMQNLDAGDAEMPKNLGRRHPPSHHLRLPRVQRENDRFHTPILISFTACPGLLGNHFKAQKPLRLFFFFAFFCGAENKF